MLRTKTFRVFERHVRESDEVWRRMPLVGPPTKPVDEQIAAWQQREGTTLISAVPSTQFWADPTSSSVYVVTVVTVLYEGEQDGNTETPQAGADAAPGGDAGGGGGALADIWAG